MRALLLIFVALFSSCKQKANVVVNTPAKDIAAAYADGTVSDIEEKDVLLKMLSDWIDKIFIVGGYDHRLTECQENWRVFDDLGHLVFTGSVAKSDTEVYLFTWVIEKNEGDLNTIFLQIGDSIEKGSEYPKSLLPYRSKG